MYGVDVGGSEETTDEEEDMRGRHESTPVT